MGASADGSLCSCKVCVCIGQVCGVGIYVDVWRQRDLVCVGMWWQCSVAVCVGMLLV